MFFPNGRSMLTGANLLDEMDGISSGYEAAEHIYPSKYDSRLRIISKIVEASGNRRFCSVCGSGATSLAKKLTVKVKKHGLFESIAMVTVSQNPNLEKIRTDIMQQIEQRWTGRCLLILDGCWWELKNEDFTEMGIRKSVGIILTSRNEDMCKHVGSHQIFHVNFLEDEEAWDLFKEKAGISFVDLDLQEMARKIVDHCDGSRSAILTIGSALKDKPRHVWKDSLRKLSEMEKVFSCIRLSYGLLNDKEAQLLFRICCLFPEDFNIPVEDLVLFGKGLQLFKKADSMHQARDRVECIIYKLKNSCFLLDGDDDNFIKVDNMCRHFGEAMSSKLKRPYIVRFENDIEEWPLKRTEYQNCGAISFMCKTIKQHPVDLKCPNLDLLQLSYGSESAQLPEGIFQGLKILKVVSLSIPSLLQSLTALQTLRTLCITESILDNRYKKPRPRIGDLLGGKMKHLEYFSFSTARPYDDFPREIGQLHNLRFLRFNRERLKYIPPGVLSKLVKLEELYLPLDFIGWGCKEEGGERINASLSEIKSLQLTAIRIGVPKGSILAEKLVEKLTRFHVFIGSHVSPDYEFETGGNSKKLLEVFDVDADDFRASWISSLVRKSEISLRLKQVRNLKSIITWEPKEDEYIEIPRWKKICISDCNELDYLAEGRIPLASFSQLECLKLFGLCNMKEIWQGLYLSKIEGSCFCNLGEIQIIFCRKLKCVFPLPAAAQLRQLQSLHICFCDEVEEIFYRKQMNVDGNQVTSSSREGGNASKGKTQLSDPKVETTSTLNPTVTSQQQQMEENIGKEDDEDVAKDEIIFPKLKTMELAYLDKLGVFYDGNHSILLPSLQSLSVFRCNHMEAFCYGIFRTPSLQHILINGNRYPVTQDLNAIVRSVCTRQSFS